MQAGLTCVWSPVRCDGGECACPGSCCFLCARLFCVRHKNVCFPRRPLPNVPTASAPSSVFRLMSWRQLRLLDRVFLPGRRLSELTWQTGVACQRLDDESHQPLGLGVRMCHEPQRVRLRSTNLRILAASGGRQCQRLLLSESRARSHSSGRVHPQQFRHAFRVLMSV